MNIPSILSRLSRVVLGTRQAEPSTRWSSWATRPAPARMDLAERSRNASRGAFLVGTPLGATIVNAFQTSLVADGPSVRSAHPNRAMRRALEAAWGRFYKRADAEGLGDLALLLGRVVASLVVNGEAVIHVETTERAEPRLRLLSPEQIVDPAMNRRPEIVQGIEFDSAGRRVAYWVRDNPDSLLMPALAAMPVRVPASDICHIFEPAFPGSARGRSWLAPVGQTILELHKLLDALGARMNTAALFAGFVTGENAFDDADGPPDAEVSLEPGVVRFLPAGSEITFPTLPTTEGADALIKHMLRAIASGVGLPPFLLTGDYSEINYSSGKLGLENFKRRVTAIRASLLGAQLLQPVWERVVTLEILSGRIHAPDFAEHAEDYFSLSALWPGFAPLDPYREAQSDVLLMQAGLRSRAEIIAARGRDVADVDAEIQADTIAPDLTAIQFSQGDQNAAA